MSTPLADRVAAHCARRHLLPSGAGVLVMCSGGADSTCLLHLLRRLHDGPLVVLSVDHGLRGERGAAEARAVAAAAGAVGLRARVEHLALTAGPGAQERARDARRAAARRVAREEGCALIATGHTASDQAETVLFRMARGTGRTGALGMADRRDDLVRPLLVATRDETRAWCRDNGIGFCDDPSNADRAFARPRVRHGLLPALERIHPGAVRHVAALADLLRDESEVLDGVIDAAWRRVSRPGGIDAGALGREPEALARLLVRRLLERAGLPGEALASAPVARVLALAAGAPGGARRLEVPGGVLVVERGVLRVAAPPAAPLEPVGLPVPGAAAFGDLTVRARRGLAGASVVGTWIDVEGPLVVRAPAPGDRLRLPGGGRQAVGRLLQSAGVPERLRGRVPVVAAGERVVWVAGRPAADMVAAPGAPATLLELVEAR